MRILRRTAMVGLLAALCPPVLCPAAPANFYLHDGDRVVFYGDSITDQRLYTTFVETYVLTRFPLMKVSFVHSGVGGDRVTGGGAGPIDVRLERDVVAYKPTVMTIMLGMNDGSYRAFDQKIFDTYAAGYRHIIQSVKEALPGIRITLIQPSPYDDVTRPPSFEGGYNKVLVRYGEFLKELGREEKLDVADLNGPVVAALEKALRLDAETAKKLVPDRVHPAPGGHLLMAESLLKAWHAPAIVTAVEINAAGPAVAKIANAQVTDLAAGERVSWTQMDAALPMPIDTKDEVLALALRASDFVEAMNQEPLRVTGLTAARYTLKIDGQAVGTFTKEEWAKGVNLATLPTPMAKQAAAVHDLTLRHNVVHFARWRLAGVNLDNIAVPAPHLKAAADALDTLEADVLVEQRAAAQPKSHKYELGAE
ncbi:MAG TPA: SGNH/GDSL hydrolase family protein [Bryobacteraceae bacterium]|nr:SGNH/GDSL hydrolase family protein [Bryobacteraceae bacterium]